MMQVNGIYINAKRSEFFSYNEHQSETIKSSNNGGIKSVENFACIGSNISSTK